MTVLEYCNEEMYDNKIVHSAYPHQHII